MKYKIICLLFCVIIFTNTTTAIKINKYPSSTDQHSTETVETLVLEGSMWTTGPILKLIAKVDLISGPPEKIQQIEKILKRPKLRILPFTIVKVSNLEFSVTYKRNLFFLRLLSPSLMYSSAVLSSQDQYFIVNIAHTIKVDNFDGYFLLIKNILLHPSRFIFIGFFDNLLVTSVPSTK